MGFLDTSPSPDWPGWGIPGTRPGEPGQAFDPRIASPDWQAWQEAQTAEEQARRAEKQAALDRAEEQRQWDEETRRWNEEQAERRRRWDQVWGLGQTLGLGGGGGTASGGPSAIGQLRLAPEQISRMGAIGQEQVLQGFRTNVAGLNAARAARGISTGSLTGAGEMATRAAAEGGRGQFELAAEIGNRDLIARELGLDLSQRELDVTERGQNYELLARLIGLAA